MTRFSQEDLAKMLEQGNAKISDPASVETAKELPKKMRQIEHDEQKAFVKLSKSIPVSEGGVLANYLVMIPNSNDMSWLDREAAVRTMAKWKSLGFRKGASDLLLLLPRGGFSYLAMEFKKPTEFFKSTADAMRAVSVDQRRFADDIERAGGLWSAVYGCKHAFDLTQKYLTGKATPG